MAPAIPIQLPERSDAPDPVVARPVGMPVRRFILVCAVGLFACLAWMVVRELITFERQAHLLASIADDINVSVEPGVSPSVRFPNTGESDKRRGYVQIPASVERLQAAGFDVTAQARWSRRLEYLVDKGLYAPYRRKQTAGLTIRDRHGVDMHHVRYPERVYSDFDAIPPVVVDTLLFIENQELLDDRHRYRNPAVEWDRLAHSLTLKAVSVIGPDRKTPGASTLATQLEKYHHSPGGLTTSAGEKLRQMVSASVRAYLDGEDTVATRQRIVTEYLNTVPLAAAPGLGEVHGIGNGLNAWFGADFARSNELLTSSDGPEAALAYREILSLLIAQRRPSYYLLADRDGLSSLTDTYLRLLGRAGVVRGDLLEHAHVARVSWQRPSPPVRAPYPERKWPYFVRARLTELMGVPNLYDLDRWDLAVTTTVDAEAQRRTVAFLRGLSDPARARELGLEQDGLVGRQDPAGVIYSVTLMEHVAGANLVRVQADNADRPLDINRGVKLDLGSTAKLRTLVTYLNVVASLHERYRNLPGDVLAAERARRQDALAAWVLERLAAQPDESLSTTLDAAMARQYSASPYRAFFTGGGRHTFSNFDADDNARVLSVTEAFDRSVNLVFVRMMADIVAAYQADIAAGGRDEAGAPPDAVRQLYLARFADQEGSAYLRRFHAEYAKLTAPEVLARVLEKARRSPAAVAAVLTSVDPHAGPAELAQRLGLPAADADQLASVLDRHGPQSLSLADRGYVARVHPLELWLAARLYQQPGLPIDVVLADSRDVRQEAYAWLFKTRNKGAQDRRITMLLEQEAFLAIHAFWQKLGYPFGSLVPSLATSIGSSADTPAALTELLGIIANDGNRYPTAYITGLTFGADTPYETHLARRGAAPERVLPRDVARVTREALSGVVARGTARRLNRLAPELAANIGGKTGTGDHRFERYSSSGQVIESRVVNRSAVFTFAIGDRFFGTVTAFVPGEEAAAYRFTSALPVQVLGHLLGELEPLLASPPPTTLAAEDCGSVMPDAVGGSPNRSAACGSLPPAAIGLQPTAAGSPNLVRLRQTEFVPPLPQGSEGSSPGSAVAALPR